MVADTECSEVTFATAMALKYKIEIDRKLRFFVIMFTQN